ncbi:MAG TPA: hypothetical protein VGQ31_11675 [Candidatus Limnocylindrales bacterium]|nr:hypothetical protein [Candidatus Limnocylindrales bacterium]
MNVAVIEFNEFHDEVLPSVVHALNGLDVRPDVYLPARAARQGAFDLARDLQYRLELIGGSSRWRRAISRIRGTPARHRRYDALILNSSEPPDVLEAASRIHLPTIALVHNGDRLHGGPYAAFFADPARQPAFLGRHVAASVGRADGHDWIAPFYLGDPVAIRSIDPDPDPAGRITLCVQGNVEYVRRDYTSLLAAVETLAGERSDFRVRIVGRSHWRDGRDLRAQVEARGLADRFSFSARDIAHPDYIRLVATSDLILPLVDPGVSRLAPYFTVKITSSMSMSIGLGVIPVTETSLARLYGVEEAAVTHGPGRLLDGLRAALDLDPAERAVRVAALDRVRAEALATSVTDLAAAFERLGVPIR